MSAIKNLFAVLTSPAATYEKLRNNPVWAGAALVLVAVAVLGAAVSYPKMDFEELARVQIENSDRLMTEEQSIRRLPSAERSVLGLPLDKS